MNTLPKKKKNVIASAKTMPTAPPSPEATEPPFPTAAAARMPIIDTP